MRPLNFALVRNEYVHQPQLLTSSWAELVERFSKPPAVVPQRETWSRNAVVDDIYCTICPSLFLPLDDANAEHNRFGYRRCNANVLGKDLQILDIDNDPTKDRPPLTVEQALTLFAGYEFVLYTSFNHRNPAKGDIDKFRIVIPLAAYCPKDAWELRRERMKSLWPFADPASFTLSQIFFLPVVSPERQSTYRFHHNTGNWLDWSAIEATVKRVPISAVKPAAVPAASVNLTSPLITLGDGSQSSAVELFHMLHEGYENKARCYSPFRSDNKPDCFAYRLGPDLHVFDNATRQTTPIRVLSKPVSEGDIGRRVVIDGLAAIASRKTAHLAALHTVIQPSPQPLPESPERSAVLRMDCRYLGDFPELALPEKGLAFIKSPKGTGKTEMLKQFVKEITGRVLLIGHRVALLSSLAQRLGLDDYQDTTGISGRFAISLDSLPRFSTKAGMNEKPYDTIFIDESEQVLRHLTAETLKKRRNDVFNVLIRHIQKANRVVCLDADLSGVLSVEIIAKLRGSEQLETDEVVGYLNEYQFTDRSIEIYPTKNQLVTELLTLMVSGERAFVATNVRAFAEKLAAAIQRYCEGARILVVSSHTRDDEAVKAFFNDPTAEAKKYDAVIATPSMATGVSIDTKNHFDAVFGFFSQRPLTYHDCDQAISRVRESLPTKIWIQAVDREFPPPSKRHFYELAKERERLTRMRLPGEDAEFTQGELLWFDIHSHLHWLEALWMHDKRNRFVALKEEAGFTVTYAPYDEAADELGKAAMDEAKLDALAIEVQAIMSARDLGAEDASEISRKQVKTRHEELALTKYRIKAHLGREPFTYENVYATHAHKHLQKAARIQQALTDARILVIDDRIERHFSRAAVTDFSHRTKQVEKWRELEAAANLDYRRLLADSLCFFRAWKKMQSVKDQHLPRSTARRDAQAAFDAEVAGANVTISKDQLFAIATHYAAHVDEYNLFFGSRISDPTLEGNQMKAWNATFGYFGLPLRKVKRGPRGQQVAMYEINYIGDGILLEVMADAFLSPSST